MSLGVSEVHDCVRSCMIPTTKTGEEDHVEIARGARRP